MKLYEKFILLIFLLLPLIVHANIYKWVDEKGTVHFSDQPNPDAEVVILPETQTYKPIPEVNPELPEVAPPKKTFSYESVLITQPKNKETINNNQGLVVVSAKLTPALQEGHRLNLLLDGEPLGEPKATTVFSIQGIYRGEHRLIMQVLDSQQQVVSQSEEVIFTMQRPRILN